MNSASISRYEIRIQRISKEQFMPNTHKSKKLQYRIILDSVHKKTNTKKNV